MYLESKDLIDKYIDVDEDWVVVSDKDIRIQRVIKRNNFDYDTALKRVNSQLDYEKVVVNLTRLLQIIRQKLI